MATEDPGQEALPFVLDDGRPGRVQTAVIAVLAQARADDKLADLDAALAQLAVALAGAVDRAAPTIISQPAAQLRDTLVLLGLDPKSRGARGRDPFAEFLDGLNSDGVADDGAGAAHRNAAQP